MRNHQIKLFDSTYPVKDAKDVLFSLINDKVRFIDQKIFSIKECSDGDTAHLEKRVKELKIERQQLLELFSTMGNENLLVDINCKIGLKIRQPENREKQIHTINY